MPECICGAWVSAGFARVFSDPSSGAVEQCPDCVEARADLVSGPGGDRR